MTRLLSAALAIVALLFVACGDGGAAEWLAQTEVAHRRADEALAAGDVQAAEVALRAAFGRVAPRTIAPEDARVVRQDVAFRLTSLAFERDEPEEAQRWAELGLALGRGEDVFTANLLVARGRAREALGQPVEATEDYHEALLLNEVLLDRVLEGAR